MKLYTGVVENRDDPLKIGRCQCRVVGLHTENKAILPTKDLPWAHPMQPTTSAATSGIGWSPTGPVPGTWVVIMFMDPDEQQPIMLGTIGGIPQSKGAEIAVEESGDNTFANNGVLTDGSGQPVLSGSGVPVTVGSSEAQSKPPADAKPSAPPAEPVDPAQNKDIPTTPPKGSTSDVAKSTAGIKALLAACDKLGLTTKYAKCAVLGIAGGESRWIPQKELYNYSPDRLKEIFTSVNADQIEKYSYATKKGMTRETFFSFFYGPTFRTNGKKPFLGNATDAEGGMYYGRGFIQLTGKDNYKRYGQLTGNDILNNPELLNSDIQKSAEIAVAYIIDRLDNYGTNKGAAFKAMYKPGFYELAKDAVGINSPDIKRLKLEYYEYFLGGKTSDLPTTKDSSPVPSGYTEEQIAAAPPEKRAALREDRSGNYDGLGFTDPNGKYPLRELVDEPDTNRLARGIIEGTCVKYKDTTRKTKVRKAGGGEWNQPHTAYAAQYPFNKVYETESGHVMEFDDTQGNERINIFHRAGTFMEYDPAGTKVEYIVGDNYWIMNRNGNIFVGGTCNITAQGGVNILCNANANIEVQGNTEMIMHGEANIGVAKGLDIAVGNDINIKAGGAINIQSGKSLSIHSGQGMELQASASILNKAGKNIGVEAGGEFLLRSAGITMQSTADIGIKSTNTFTMASGKEFGIKSGAKLKLNSQDVLAVDGSSFVQQSGAAKGLATPASIEDIPAIPDIALKAPVPATAVPTAVADLPEPIRDFDIVAKAETPEEWESAAGKKEANKSYNNTEFKDPENAIKPAADSQTQVGNNVQSKPLNRPDILTRSDFPLTYSISKNFIIGNFIKTVDPLRDSPALPASIGDRGGAKVLTQADLVANFAAWAENIGEPLFELLGPAMGKETRAPMKGASANSKWIITSGFRSTDWKDYGTSEHGKGRAVDFALLSGGGGSSGRSRQFDFVKQIEKILPYNQLILEYRRPGSARNPGSEWQNWIHVSHSQQGNGKMAFTMVDDAVVNAAGQPVKGTRGFYLF